MSSPASGSDIADSLAGDLKQHIYQAHADEIKLRAERKAAGLPPAGSRWVMSLEWFNEVRRLDDRAGRPVWHPPAVSAPLALLGIPVEVREDGGVPHLEPNR